MITETINQLKEVDLFDEFKSAMETLVKETSKPQIEWDDDELNKGGLKYDPDYYWNFRANCNDGYFDTKEEEYEEELARVSLKPASDNTVPFKSFYCDSYYSDYKMSGLDFGVITWNPYLSLREAFEFKGYNEDDSTAYYDYINKVTDINFSCFYGKTPQQILDIFRHIE